MESREGEVRVETSCIPYKKHFIQGGFGVYKKGYSGVSN